MLEQHSLKRPYIIVAQTMQINFAIKRPKDWPACLVSIACLASSACQGFPCLFCLAGLALPTCWGCQTCIFFHASLVSKACQAFLDSLTCQACLVSLACQTFLASFACQACLACLACQASLAFSLDWLV